MLLDILIKFTGLNSSKEVGLLEDYWYILYQTNF